MIIAADTIISSVFRNRLENRKFIIVVFGYEAKMGLAVVDVLAIG
jgi:hypothetical protein